MDFVYHADYQVVVCKICQTCVGPTQKSVEKHLRSQPHRLTGQILKTYLEYTDALNLSTLECLVDIKPVRRVPAIKHLKIWTGYQCLLCEPGQFLTIHLPRMRDHTVVHSKKAKTHKETPIWEECSLQSFFTTRSRVDYFVVEEEEEGSNKPGGVQVDSVQLSQPEKDLFVKLEKDFEDVKEDLEEQAGIVHDIKDSRSERIPWLHDLTRFPYHIGTLRDEEIWSSYCLPRKSTLDTSDEDATDTDLVRILAAAEEMLRDAYQLCSDSSPDRKMTQQRALILNEFYSGASGKAGGFRPVKNASTLVSYFTTMKQLLVYYYRVVYSENGHFTRTQSVQRMPSDTIQSSPQQRQAMGKIINALALEDEDEGQLALKHAIRQLYLALICHRVGSVPFRSPVLSFCAMLSRKVRGKERGLWEEPGNFNSHLSALTWTAQLILFDYACFQEQDDEDQIPIFLAKICTKFFQQLAETPFGHILQWRLYLFKVGKAAIAKHQATWSLDGQEVTYRKIDLQMSHVSQLALCAYQHAHTLLHDELLLGAPDLTPLESWRLKDDLDLEDFGGSWLSHPSNREFVKLRDLALIQHIQNTPPLRKMFLREGSDGTMELCSQAMAIYESYVQDFLKSVLVLCHVTPGPPLRASELLSVTYQNTARPRHLLIWEKLVLIYTQYHKGQQQSGAYKDNIRFLPREVGNLLLPFLGFVNPLRQLFLRQQTPGALLSPYLWAKLDGTVWADEQVSNCLKHACARAQVPQFQTAWWRQVAASITKEKFSAKERANFDLDDHTQENVEDELDLVVLAELSNHSYHTFNHAYAGSTTLTMSTLLHRGFRASESWRNLFRFDYNLHSKRPRAVSDTLSLRMLDASKRGQFRQRGTYSEADLLSLARKLFSKPDLQFRAPGQQKGVLAVLGPRSAEQVVIVLGTGSGKSLVFLLSAAIVDAGTTILILPTVALRIEMIRRCHEVGIRPLIWTPDCKQSASLVLMSAEATCTESFLVYTRQLVNRQQLARIVIDEAHLTITASEYRKSMSQLGWYVRQIRTQTVWLTATLPPVMQDLFLEQNKLVRPTIVRESTNRPNIEYCIQGEDSQGSLPQKAADLVRRYWPRTDIFDHRRDKIIIYCQTHTDVEELQEVLQCPVYTSKSGSEEEKAAILSSWLHDLDQPVIAATSALGIGFDYPYVRWVIHAGSPEKLTDFSQESGRAGRDGQSARSIILIPSGWQVEDHPNLDPDRRAMQLYLSQAYCYRGILSQFLDQKCDWRWCMDGEKTCQTCIQPHRRLRPAGLEFGQLTGPPEEFTGPTEVLRQDHVRAEALDQYEHDLKMMGGICLLCRVQDRPFDHHASSCARRFSWIQAKDEAYHSQKKRGRHWIPRFVACWKCYQPQEICRVADPAHEETSCRFPDMVMPLCYGIFHRPGSAAWLLKHFQYRCRTEGEYMLWLGEESSLNGNECIQATRVTAQMLSELR